MKKLDKKEIRFEELGNVVGGTTVGPVNVVGPVNETGPLNYLYKQNTGPLNYPYKHNTGPLPLGTCDPPCWKSEFGGIRVCALDKDFVEKNEGSADDIAFREKAVAAIVIPLAEEVGLPFTLEELKEYEQDQMKEMNLSEDELDQVAGGRSNPLGRPSDDKPGYSSAACAIVGVGIGVVKDKKRKNTVPASS